MPKNPIGAYKFLSPEESKRYITLDKQRQAMNLSPQLEAEYKALGEKGLGARSSELSKLEPYRNTWHERVIREEIKQAAKDGKTKLQFPTGETAMKIEGLGEGSEQWTRMVGDLPAILKPRDLKVGVEVKQGAYDWIITDVLGENTGKFKAVPKGTLVEGMTKKFPEIPMSEIENFIKTCL